MFTEPRIYLITLLKLYGNLFFHLSLPESASILRTLNIPSVSFKQHYGFNHSFVEKETFQTLNTPLVTLKCFQSTFKKFISQLFFRHHFESNGIQQLQF